ncbi:hypothetical protein KY360_00530 [Candidatus Woesearchaeota archaeon]|nr:hypothetical protein [Candidatus Woesearchaeota archaeon]
MKKKGFLTMTQMVLAILALVLLVFAGGVVRLTREYYMSKVENRTGFGPTTGEFVPYDKQLTGQEADADSSMKALACAADIVALGDYNWSRCPEEGRTQKGADGVSYGNVDVRCFDAGAKPVALNTDKKKALEQLVKETIFCWKRFEGNNFENVYCSNITVPKGLSITNKEFRKALAESGELGSDLAGWGYLDLQEYRWEIGNPIKGASEFYMCGDNAGDNQVFFVEGEAARRNFCPNVQQFGKLECEVAGFELMQRISKDERSHLNPLRWISSYNQPRWVAYFQGFPQGKEKFWHVDTLSMVNVGLIVGFAVLDVVPLIGKGLGKGAKAAFVRIFKRSATEAAQELSQRAVREGIEEFGQNLAERGTQKLVKEAAEQAAEELGERFAKRTAAEVADVSKDVLMKGLRDTIGEGAEEVAQPLLKQVDDVFAGIISNKNFYEPTTQTLTREGREALSERLGKEVFSADNLDLLGKKVAAASPIVVPPGSEDVLLELSIKKVRNQIMEPFEKAAKDAAEEAAFSLTRETVAALFRRRGAKEAFKAIASETGEGINEKIARESAEKAFRMIGSMNSQAADLAIKQGREFAEELGEEGLEAISKGMSKGLKDVEASLVKEVTTTSRMKKLITRAGIIPVVGYLGMSAEAATEIFRPVGINSFGLDAAGTLGEPRPYDMVEELRPFLVTPSIHKGDRFYVASPCKANMVLRRELCECSRMPVGYGHYSFNFDKDKPMPAIEVKNIDLNRDLLKDDKRVIETALDQAAVLRKHLPIGKKKVAIELYLNYTEKNAIDLSKKLISKSCVRQKKKYPGLLRNLDDIRTKEQAIAEMEKCDVVQFYMDIVRMTPYADIKESVRIGGEVVENFIPTVSWEYYYPYLITKDVQKSCLQRDTTDWMIDFIATDYVPFFTGEMVAPENNVFLKPSYKTDCITVNIQRYEGWNNGTNYCIDDYPYLETVRWALTGVEIGAAVALTVFTGGTAAPIGTAIVGLATGFLEEELARYAKWPAYDMQGIPCDELPNWLALTGVGAVAIAAEEAIGMVSGCVPDQVVPIANTGLTESQENKLKEPVER